jgi:hypothetical protein
LLNANSGHLLIFQRMEHFEKKFASMEERHEKEIAELMV